MPTRQVVVLAEEGAAAKRIATLLGEPQVSTDPAELRSSCAAAVLLAPQLATPFVRVALAHIHRLALQRATILITDFDPRNALLVPRGLTEAVLWRHEIHDELPGRVQALLARDVPARACALFESRIRAAPSHVQGAARDLLRVARAAFLGPDVPVTHQACAARVGSDGTGLRDAWRSAGLPARPEALIDWALLARLAELRSRGMSLERAAYAVGVEPWRAQRAAYRRMQMPAGALDPGAVLDALGAWLMPGGWNSAMRRG